MAVILGRGKETMLGDVVVVNAIVANGSRTFYEIAINTSSGDGIQQESRTVERVRSLSLSQTRTRSLSLSLSLPLLIPGPHLSFPVVT